MHTHARIHAQVEALLPKVDAEVAPDGYLGYKAADVINDHDVALGYVLAHHAHLLPSFASLPLAQQLSVRFTQAKMQFNHGWLVQAEAPPKVGSSAPLTLTLTLNP